MNHVKTLRPVRREEIEAFQRDGAVLLKNILGPEWVDLVREGFASESGRDVGIVDEVSELALDLQVLLIAVRTNSLVPFGAVPRAQRGRIELEIRARVRAVVRSLGVRVVSLC